MHTDPEVLALVALGERDAATPEDLDHIAHCAVCGHEVDELGHLTSVGRSISDHFTLETPSPEVWNRIRAELGFGDDFSSELVPPPVPPRTAPLAGSTATPVAPVAGANGRPPAGAPTSPDVVPLPVRDRGGASAPPRRRVLSLALAAVLALIAGVGGTLAWQSVQGRETVLWTAQLSALPDWSGAGGEAKVEEDANGQRRLVVTMQTGRPVDGIQQVWLMDRDGKSMVQVGQLTGDSGFWSLSTAVDVDRYPVVDVSDEPPDGQVAHSGNSIVRGLLNV